MARKPFMEMDLEEFEDNNTVGDIDEPSLDFDFDDDTEDDIPDIPEFHKEFIESGKAKKYEGIALGDESGMTRIGRFFNIDEIPAEYKKVNETYKNLTSPKDDHNVKVIPVATAASGVELNDGEMDDYVVLYKHNDTFYYAILQTSTDPDYLGLFAFANDVNDLEKDYDYWSKQDINTKRESSNEEAGLTSSSDETPEIPETPDFDNPDDTSTTTQEGYVQEGMFDAGFNNLRSKIAQALGEKFKVTNVVKGMGGKDKFDITEQDVEDPTKTTVESTGTACNVTVRGGGKIGRKIGITLSSALDKILEIVKKPDLVLESGFYNISRNVNGGFYQEADDETSDDEDFDIDAEIAKAEADDNKTEETTETKEEEEPTSDDDKGSTENVEEVDIDIESFGSDTSDVQNEYDQKDVDSLNKLIAAESEAINDYFDASKDTRNEDLRTLFSDIGHEERFHLEQLMYVKSTLTGEKYEPRDPEVKKEYEELISNGMDEDEAISTAVDKHRIDGGDADMDDVEQEAAYIYDTLRNSEILTEYCCKAIEQKRVKNALMSAETKFVIEAFIQESLENVTTASKKDTKILSPIDILMKGIAFATKSIIKMSEIIKDTLHKTNLKNTRRRDWIKRHGITGLFKSGVSLYFWNDNANSYEVYKAFTYIDMLYRLSRDVGLKCGIKLNQQAQRQPIRNAIKYSSVEDGVNKLKGGVLTKTKIVINDANKDLIAKQFFGYVDGKPKSEMPDPNANSIFNDLRNVIVTAQQCAVISTEVLNALKRLEGDRNSIFYKNRPVYDKAVSQMEFIVKKYQEFITCLAHDLKVLVGLNNTIIKESATEQTSGTQTSNNAEGAYAGSDDKYDYYKLPGGKFKAVPRKKKKK